jgi:membrane peptidoglycan carboxypeptidase
MKPKSNSSNLPKSNLPRSTQGNSRVRNPENLIGYLWNRRRPIFFGISLAGFAILFFYLGGSFFSWESEKPRVVKSLSKFSAELNENYDPSQHLPIRILDQKGVLIGEFYRKNVRPLRVENLADHKIFTWALLSSEDRDFYHHPGINIMAVMRAVLINLAKFRISQGGSTITQQLAKLSLALGERNFFNKLTELYATFYIEANFSKEEILAMYLNQIYLGQDNIGVESASRYYFDKSAKDLNPAEAAMIVGLIPAPSIYNPVDNLRISLKRQKMVLAEMARMEDPQIRPSDTKISPQFNALVDESIRKFRKAYSVIEIEEDPEKQIRARYESSIGSKGYDRNFNVNLAPDFNLEIRRHILTQYSEEDLDGRRITVHTSLDYEKQKIAEAALKEGIETIRKEILSQADPVLAKKKKAKPADINLVKEISSGMRGSFVSIQPSTGNVEVFVNNLRISNSYRPNRIESSYRQPGSTIKALVYTLAFEKRLVHPSTIVKDEKISIGGYSPRNWYSGYRGEVTVRRAFAQSINTISVKLLNQMGMDYFLDRLGEILSLDSETVKKRFSRNLSLALGSGELTPMELATIYATIQNGGKKVTPRKILRVTDSASEDDFMDLEPRPYQVLDPVACAMALDTLQSVLTEEGTMPIKISADERFPMGGKTGTVQSPKEALKKWGNLSGVRDAWFAGLIPDSTSVVWIGNEWGAPFPGSGSGTTGRIWWKFAYAFSNRTETIGKSLLNQEIQGSYLKLDICADDGTQLENDYQEVFLTLNGESSMQNPRFCKYPLFAQYYYIGDTPPRRSIEIPLPQKPDSEPEDTQAREGESEIQKIDKIKENLEEKKPNPSSLPDRDPFTPDGLPPLPVTEGGVELEEPFINTPREPAFD